MSYFKKSPSGDNAVYAVLRRLRRKPTLAAGLLAGALLIGGGVYFLSPAPRAVAETPDDDGDGKIRLSAEQRKAAGIEVVALARTAMPQEILAAAEVQVNGYHAAYVGPRVTATVVSRHARLGDKVQKGQALVTLYSQDMAEAQSNFVLAERNLARYRRLDAAQAVAARDLDEARATRQELFGRLQSFGLSPAQISALSRSGLGNSKTGQFTLSSPITGTVTKDTFREGEVIVIDQESRPLFEIADPQDVWIEARLTPGEARKLGSKDAVVLAGEVSRKARILQTSSVVDEATRTVLIRLGIDNRDLFLRPGEFVRVKLFGRADPVLRLPTDAVLRDPAGNWIVYVQGADGALSPQRVKRLYSAGGFTAIDGIAEGTPVVSKGAFLVHSEAQKASFADED